MSQVTSQIPGKDLHQQATQQHCKRWTGGTVIGLLVACASLATGCSEKSKARTGNSIPIGASLPFTGKESALGRNLEQALILALEDVNNAGGIAGTPLELVSRDSNSGSERGLNDLVNLVYEPNIQFVIGPEENELASQIVPDVKQANILNITPGYAAPEINRSSTSGAWLKLAPTDYSIGCGMGMHAQQEGATTANTLSTLEDYNANLATAFKTNFPGKSLPSVTVESGQSTYASSITKVFDYGADRTLLVAYPATAANIITEWSIGDRRGFWYLSPLLRTEAFLLNVPYGSLDNHFGLSPSLSLPSECQMLSGDTYGSIECGKENAKQFSSHFAARWDGARPFPAANLYYDAVVLLAFGLQYAVATTGEIPAAPDLHRIIRSLNMPTNGSAYWYDIPTALQTLAQGIPLRYAGAGTEYEFDKYGAADHRVFDTWTISKQAFVETGAFYAHCAVFR